MDARFLAHVRDSFFFLPADQYPVLDVGWTLNYEMYFYLLFALALMLQRLLAPLIAGAAVLAVIGLAARGCDHFLCTYYSNGYVKFFVFGIALYYPWATVAPCCGCLRSSSSASPSASLRTSGSRSRSRGGCAPSRGAFRRRLPPLRRRPARSSRPATAAHDRRYFRSAPARMSKSYDQKFFDWVSFTAARSARDVVPVVVEHLRPASVLDFGCGQGAWLAAWRAHRITDVVGVDGDYVARAALLFPAERSCRAARGRLLQRRNQPVPSDACSSPARANCSQ
jgi:hypothetical protein